MPPALVLEVKGLTCVAQMKGAAPEQLATIATVIGGLVGVGILGYLGLTL